MAYLESIHTGKDNRLFQEWSKADDSVCIWWLHHKDFHGMTSSPDGNPFCWPDYITRQFFSLHGRAGRGRLWVPSHLDKFVPKNGLGISENDPRWTPILGESGGIVIERKDADLCRRWGKGIFTTLELERISE
jgi:hypothetical protein